VPVLNSLDLLEPEANNNQSISGHKKNTASHGFLASVARGKTFIWCQCGVSWHPKM